MLLKNLQNMYSHFFRNREKLPTATQQITREIQVKATLKYPFASV